ncbi:MAG: endonuclease/exonuclease/phosphatase family protein [Bacteroides sp.]|nr:endonuclease/exonuclease/phosphatase family protein [Roseburia sp.]MCM1346372.1 endonuclease/exonuclease/phosphatase family protein [Bacteroides sp.]MCM1420407.1 endonuclease/exonuclease/phosphatase family protein [Bacteroides sp.]
MKFKMKKLFLSIFIAANVVVIAAMIFCAYTTYLPPQTYPNWSYFGLIFPVFLFLDIVFVAFWLVFKWKLVILPLTGLLLCIGAVRTYFPVNIPQAHPADAIKVLSYNVLHFGEDSSVASEDNPILNYILQSGADIVCLQEAGGRDMERMGEVFDSIYPYSEFGASRMAMVLILSKYPILSTEEINYPSETNSSFAHELLVGKDTVLVINNHLESYKLNDDDKQQYKQIIKNPESDDVEEKYHSLVSKIAKATAVRGVQADSVAAFIARSRHKYIISCGDFNDSPVSYVHHAMARTLNDAYTRSGNGPGLSYNRNGMYFRLDNILASDNFVPYEAVVDRKIKASDHYPISCYLKMK